MSEEWETYAIPGSGMVPLGIRPRLASWDSAGHSSQFRLQEFLDEAVRVCLPQIDALPDPLAMRLDVGLPSATPLLDQHDLDNYLYPLAAHLTKVTHRQFVSVWGTKQHAEHSFFTVAAAEPDPALSPGQTYLIRTTASSQSTAFKEQINDQLAHATPLPDGPIRLHISYRVGPHRSWPNLWKPTIDALGHLLGRTTPGRPWHPRDGRITELGLNTRTEPAFGNETTIKITAQAATLPT